jgi:acyl-CoA thioesterase-1
MDHPPPATSVFTALYFGDSLTAGSTLPPEQKSSVWTNLVEQVSRGKFRAINEGLGGRPTDSLADFQEALRKHAGAFDLLVIALGGNDARDISGNCVPHALKNIRAMITLARASCSTLPILLAGPANIRKDTLGPTKPIANEREQNLRDLNVAYEKLALETSCQFVSLYGTIPAASLVMDGVHPDAEGNQPIAAAMLEALTKLTDLH